MAEENIDILILQEPYAVSNIPVRPMNTAKLITANCPDEYPWAAIIIVNESLRVTNVRQAGCEFLAVAHVESEREEFFLASVNMKRMADPGQILNKVDNLIRSTEGANLIMGGDTNSQSTLWGAETTNERGEVLEEFASLHGLQIMNKPNQPPMFSTIRASSHIDVTLSKGSITKKIINWTVRENVTSSDHNVIRYDLSSGEKDNTIPSQPENPTRYNTRHINIKQFHAVLRRSTPILDTLPTDTPEDVEILSAELEKAVMMACRKTILTRRIPKVQVKLWTDQLTNLKRKAYQLRRYA